MPGFSSLYDIGPPAESTLLGRKSTSGRKNKKSPLDLEMGPQMGANKGSNQTPGPMDQPPAQMPDAAERRRRRFKPTQGNNPFVRGVTTLG